MVPDFATTVGVVVGVLGSAFGAVTAVGIVLLVRRARRARSAPLPGRTDAGVSLVRADDALRAANDDLAFAIAQFGEDRTRDFAAALDRARGDLSRAFALQQKLDDAAPEGERRRRDWAKDIRGLADRARSSLEAEAARFQALRRDEENAPETVRALREAIATLAARRATADSTMADLAERYVAEVIAPVATNPEKAEAALADARTRLDAAEAALTTSRVPAVTASLADAAGSIRVAAALLDAIDHRRDELASAEQGIADLVREESAAIESARALRDSPPDPDSAAAVNDAIADVEAQLATVTTRGPRDPVADLDRLVDASDALDIAVAAARNQQRRLDGARSALAGALVSARTQISAISDYIGSHGGGAGARTRLAEAQRELIFAENEADPVAALDAARRAQTHARDADALARYAGAG